MLKLHIIIASTRQGRQGPVVAHWFHALACRHGKFDVRLVDLAKVNLPLLDEPLHPRFLQYEHEHTKKWSAIVNEADAYVFVTSEYNFGAPPSLINALDFVWQEWQCKPLGFVSYGGVSGGTRSVQMTKEVATTLKMMPIPEMVSIPFFSQYIDDSGAFSPPDVQDKAGIDMLEELLKWAEVLKPMRMKNEK